MDAPAMSVTPVREPIFAALWALISGALDVEAAFPTSGRYLIPLVDVPTKSMPAIFQIQHGEAWDRKGKGIPNKRTLHASIVMYTSTASHKENLPSTQLNNALDVLESVIETHPNPANAQTLGGLVEHVYMEGRPEIFEGMVGAGDYVGVLVAPVTILIP
jgi:hypothetical protein